MAYLITHVEINPFPDAMSVDRALQRFTLSIDELRVLLDGYSCAVPRTTPGGYQQHLAKDLEAFLQRSLSAKSGLSVVSPRYSASLGERADIAIGSPDGGVLFVEIEFRPNVEKDLAKFQIGHHSGRLAIGVIVMAIVREELNPAYTSMPEYHKFVRVITEFRPLHPLLIVGIGGKHLEA